MRIVVELIERGVRLIKEALLSLTRVGRRNTLRRPRCGWDGTCASALGDKMGHVQASKNAHGEARMRGILALHIHVVSEARVAGSVEIKSS